MPYDLGALFTARAFQESRRQAQPLRIEGYAAAKGELFGRDLGLGAGDLRHA